MRDMTNGDRVQSRVFRCDGDRVGRWAEVAQDRNPLHLDPEFSAQTQFGVPIAHGHLIACVLVDELHAILGDQLVDGGEVSIRFRAPVPVGREIRIDYQHIEDQTPVMRASCDDVEVLQVELELPRSGGFTR